MKLLIIGQAPSRQTDGGPPFSGQSGRRLAAFIGVPQPELPERFDLANLLPSWEGKAGKGDRFDVRRAREAAAAMDLTGRERVLLVGVGVARAFGIGKPPLLEWFGRAGVAFAVVPHPSGVNPWWNDPAHREAARAFLSALI